MSSASASKEMGLPIAEESKVASSFRPLLYPRAWGILLAWIVLADWTVYRGGGWSGWAVFLSLLPVIVFLAPKTKSTAIHAFWVSAGLSLLIALKLVWTGTSE